MTENFEKQLDKSFKEKNKYARVFNWLKSIIDVDDVPMRREYIPIYDLMKECFSDGESWISSNYSDGDEIFTFTIRLKKEEIKE